MSHGSCAVNSYGMVLVLSIHRMEMEDSTTSTNSSSSSFDSDKKHTLSAIQIATQSTLEFFHMNEWEEGG